jgi:MscS family membrane protein
MDSNLKLVKLFVPPSTAFASTFILIASLCLVLLGLQPVLAEDNRTTPTVKDLLNNSTTEETTKAVIATSRALPEDEFDRGSPRSSVLGLAEALDRRDYDRAINYLDMRNLPPDIRRQGAELLRELKIIADRSLWVDSETISNDPKGYQDDGLPSYRDIIARLKTPDGQIDILMQRVPDGKGGRVWKLSNNTVSEIPVLYRHFGYGPYGDKLSKMMPDLTVFGLELWQWVMLSGIMLAAYLISWLATYLFTQLLRLQNKHPYTHLKVFVKGPVRFLIFILLVRANFYIIAPSYSIRAIFEAKTILTLAIAWMATGVVEMALGRIGDRMRANDNEQAITLLRPAGTLIKVVILLLAVITWLDNLGFNVTAMLAGLGVGGIAVGLAAQKSIENLIGAITLYTAQPVRIGEFCRVGSTLGVVEEIGLRATSIRTLDRTLVTIPNAEMSNMDIENLAKRDKILFRRTLRLRNDAKPDQVRHVLEGVRGLFSSRPDVDPEPARIRFTDYEEYALKLEIFAYILTSDFNEYLAIIEELNLQILDIITDTGAELAVPARSVRFESEVPAPA